MTSGWDVECVVTPASVSWAEGFEVQDSRQITPSVFIIGVISYTFMGISTSFRLAHKGVRELFKVISFML